MSSKMLGLSFFFFPGTFWQNCLLGTIGSSKVPHGPKQKSTVTILLNIQMSYDSCIFSPKSFSLLGVYQLFFFFFTLYYLAVKETHSPTDHSKA